MTEKVVIRWDDLFYQPSTAVAFVKPAGSIDDVDFENAGTKLDLKKQDQGGAFEGSIELRPGVYQFLFFLDGSTWRHSDSYLTTTVGGKTVNYIEVGPDADNELAMHHTQIAFTDDLFDDPAQPLLQTSQSARYGTQDDYEDEEDDQGGAAASSRRGSSCCISCCGCSIM